MILRVRSRDGLERVSVPDGATVSGLISAVCEQLKLPEDQPLVLSRDKGLLLAKDESSGRFADMRDVRAPLSSLDLRHGDMVYLWYPIERTVEGPKVPVVPAGSFGRKMTVDDMVAKQIRIERQEQPHCQMLSFDRAAANQFQLYVSETLGFSIQRGGFMYGSCDEDGEVKVDFIYEPPQTGTESSLMLHRDEDEERSVDVIASALGLCRVGFIFTRSAAQSGKEDQNYTMSASELRLAAELHAEAMGLIPKRGAQADEAMPDALKEASAGGGGNGDAGSDGGASKGAEGFKQFSIGIVKLEANEDGGSDVHFEAFQLSDQCVKLFADGVFADPEESKGEIGSAPSENGNEDGHEARVTKMKREVIVLRKDTFEVDNDFFLVAVKIADHEGPLGCTFPIENRLITASERDLKSYFERNRKIPQFAKKLADFHLLLFLSHILDPMTDLPVIAEAVRIGGPVPEGYQIILESFQ